MINDDDIVRWAYLLGPTFQIENTEGRPLTGGWMEVYIHGTRNKYYCASDFDGTLHPFKIQLDSLGANVVLASPVHSYDIYVYNKFGSLVMSRYNVIPATGEGTYIGDIVTIDSPDNTVDVSTDSGTNWHISIKDTVDTLELLQNEVATAVTSINDRIDDIDLTLANKKDKQSELVYGGNTHMTITRIKQDENGELTEVKYEPIDIPPQVPNVEITSPNGTIEVQSSTDVQTNTKTFTIDINKGDVDYYIGSKSTVEVGTTNYNITSNLVKSDGNIDITHPGKGLYLVCVNANVRPSGIRNEQHEVWLSVGPNNTYTMMHSLDWTNPQDIDISCASILKINGNEPLRIFLSYGSTPTVGVDLTVGNVSVYRLDSVLGQGDNSGLDKVYHDSTLSGDGTQANPLSVVNQGTTYTAGDGIDITNDVISTDIEVQNADKVNVNLDFGNTIQTVNTISTDGSTVRTDGFNFTLPTIKAGNGISFTKVGTETTIAMDSEVGDVVETVEKLKQDLDTQITTNFDMPNISQVYDFADPSVSTLANGACMLCQSFTIPINHELRTTTDDADTPTLLGIYSQQNFAHKIMLALYEYTYAGEGEEHGSSTYVGDTGPVNVVQGVNEFPLKNRNPSITELRSDKVYYATLYLPNASSVNGLLLAGCSGYGNASIPAEPRLTCAVENITWNGQELDMSDPTTTLNHYQVIQIPGEPTYYQYYIGPWNSGYNERQNAPRFYMQIRNGEYNVPVVPTVPFNDLGDVLPRGTLTQSDIPSFSPSQANSAYRDVTPLMNVTITAFEWIDGMNTCAGWAAANCVFDSGFANNLSGVSNSVVDLGQVVSGTNPGYAHRITFTTPLTLTASTTYRFLCGCTDGSPYFKVWLDPTNIIYFGNNGWYVAISNLTRDDHHAGMYNKLYDNNNNHYVI